MIKLNIYLEYKLHTSNIKYSLSIILKNNNFLTFNKVVI
jgi:hypothetical protein